MNKLVDRHVADGLPHDEAMRRARLDMGGFDQVKEEHRDARGVRLLEDLGSDLRYAVRQVKRSPGFAVLAVLCLGLGIGANTSIFSALNSVLFRPLPVADPGRLVMLSRGTSANFSYPDFQDLQARGRLLSGLTASFPMESDLEVDGVSEFVAAEVVSANYGSVLGVAPALGRWFTSETEPVAVISHAVWQNRFGGSANILGRRIGSEAQSYTIVGVAPRAFTGIFAPYRTDIWVPMRTRPATGGDARQPIAPAGHGLRPPAFGCDAGAGVGRTERHRQHNSSPSTARQRNRCRRSWRNRYVESQIPVAGASSA